MSSGSESDVGIARERWPSSLNRRRSAAAKSKSAAKRVLPKRLARTAPAPLSGPSRGLRQESGDMRSTDESSTLVRPVRESRPACAAATLHVPLLHVDRQSETRTSATRSVADLALRLAAGRTPEMLLTLMSPKLFGQDGPPVSPADLLPQRSLFANVSGEDCAIVDTFIRRGEKLADVAPLKRRKVGDGSCLA